MKPTHVFLLLGHRLPLFLILPRLFLLIDLVASRRSIEIHQGAVPNQDGLLHDVFKKHLVVRGDNDRPSLSQEVSFQPESCVQVLPNEFSTRKRGIVQRCAPENSKAHPAAIRHSELTDSPRDCIEISSRLKVQRRDHRSCFARSRGRRGW
jgi:hypothetical protein